MGKNIYKASMLRNQNANLELINRMKAFLSTYKRPVPVQK